MIPSPPEGERVRVRGGVPFLEAQPDDIKPLMHCWLPAHAPELNAPWCIQFEALD
jgi:hypothetical protein